ncbi:DUF4249 domain-containing protein [Arcticibacter sp.]|jgi:hypothetical protein|uniref:DUF4249 domain-containing protein n=1 Tax=Arcticibacter sp. TaxID=1872630 RepID=UPI00388E2A12
MRKYISHIAFSLALLTFACKETYEPEVNFSATNLLVVEGLLNGNGVTTIRLSRTSNNSSNNSVTEAGANVEVEDEQKNTYSLSEASRGVYTTKHAFVAGHRYRLLIKTANGSQYASEYVTLLSTPEIDSLPWKRVRQGVQIYASTHDQSNKTRYYRWEYEETWIIVPSYHSRYEIEFNENADPVDKFPYRIFPRRPENAFPDSCWQTETSKSINLGSSSRLKDDVISLAPVSYIPQASWKLDTRYSILVKQYALSAAGFEYWENMKKNTEGLGSIFDPQPSEIRGNITCVSDPKEQVVGFFDASTTAVKRLFISNREVSNWNYNSGCIEVSALEIPDSLVTIFPQNTPLNKETRTTGQYVTGVAPACVDCRLKGVPVKPDFW